MTLWMFRDRLKAVVAAAALLGAPALPASAIAAAPVAAADRAALSAYEAFRAASATRLARYEPELRGHVLEPHYEYWKLKLRIREATADEVARFFARHGGTYVAELLRDDWLKILGQRQAWEAFAQVLGTREREDPEVRCYALAARLARGDVAAQQSGAAVWLTPGPLIEGCRRVVDHLIDAGQIRISDVWLRVRTLFSEGQYAEARRTLSYFPRDARPSEQDLRFAARQPGQLLARKLPGPEQRVARELAVLALVRLAADTPHQAAVQLEGRLGAALAEADRQYVWRAIAQSAARRHDPRALEWFARVPASVLGDAALAWKARAALREGDWEVVREAIDAMSEGARRDPTWVYWTARALAAQGHLIGAQTRYLSIFRGTGFYNLLAAEELGEPVAIPEPSHEPTDSEVDTAQGDPALVRGLALQRLGLRDEAMREWAHAVQGMDDAQLIAASEMAHRAGAFERAINTAARTTFLHNYNLRYLAPYREVFSQYAQAHGVDETWVYAVVRQESRFTAVARSAAGARGLMQVMPGTAKWVARRAGLRGYRPDRMSEVEINVILGTRYLRSVFDRFGHPLLALAAYNAGPSRALRWQDAKPLEGAIYAETIPFAETRDYVKKVLSNATFYAALLQGRSLTLKEQLGLVPAAQSKRASAAKIARR